MTVIDGRFPKGNSAATKHGAGSKRAVSRAAGYRKQALLKPLALTQRDLSPAGRYRLHEWAIASAQVYLFDLWIAEHGLLDEKGETPGFTATYYAAKNTASRLYSKLEPHLLAAAKTKEGGGLDEILAEYGEGGRDA